MAKIYRMMVSTFKSTEMAEDHVVNTFYLRREATILTDEDAGNLAQDAANLFKTYRQLPIGWDRTECRIYDIADPEPREPLAVKQGIGGGISGNCGPREVAFCLSYYADRNLPRNRGRMYLGPWRDTLMAERPGVGGSGISGEPRVVVEDLQAGLRALGGVDVDWVQYSPTNGVAKDVTFWWADNEWDTMRSRGLKATARVSGAVNE